MHGSSRIHTIKREKAGALDEGGRGARFRRKQHWGSSLILQGDHNGNNLLSENAGDPEQQTLLTTGHSSNGQEEVNPMITTRKNKRRVA